jgi:amino acid transporter
MPQEDRKERVDRELIELLNEVRVALPGVQVLFAFLLVVPFQQGFVDVSELARLAYFAGLASSAVAIAFLIAPASYHRINLRRGVEEKERMFFTSSRLTLIGTAFLAAGICCSMFVVADILFGGTVALVIALLTAVVIVSLWYVLPLWARTTGDSPRGTN